MNRFFKRSITIPRKNDPSYTVFSKGVMISKRKKIITANKTITNSYIVLLGPTVSVLVFKPNPRRTSLLIQNRTIFSIYMDFDKPANATNSFEIFGQGTYDEAMTPSLGAVYMLGINTGAGDQRINVMETYT